MSNSRSKELTKNTFIITLGRISTQFITFLLLPLYTALLTKEEYGTVDLITTLVQLLIPVMSIMIDQGVFRYLLNCETEAEKKKTISSAFFLLLITSAVTVLLYATISLFVPSQYKLWLLLILIATAFSNLFLQIARGLRHTGDYAFGSFVCSASTIILNVICIACLRMGAAGMLIATFAGNTICCLFLYHRLQIGRYLSTSAIDKCVAKDELKYSAPLIPNQLSLWVMNSSDRIIVTFILGAATNGVLAVSHKFPAIYMTFFNIFQLAWHETGTIHYFDKDRDQFFTDMVKQILSIFSTLCMGVIVALPLVFHLLVNSSFGEAYYNVPIYLAASLFNVVIGLLGVVYVATKRTTEIAKTTLLAAIINIVVHIGLINIIGLYAASISTFAGYLVTMIYRIVDSRKYLKIKYDFKQIIVISISVAICCFVYYLNNRVVSIAFLPVFIIYAFLCNRKTIDDVLKMVEERTGFSKKKAVTILLIMFLVLSLSGGIYVYNKIISRPREIQTVYQGDIQTIDPERVVYFTDLGADDFTCTGLTYDSADDTYWIGDYGALTANDQPLPMIIEIDKELSSIAREIRLDHVVDSSENLQGIAYDSDDDWLWLALGRRIIAIRKDGEIISTIEMGKYAGSKANGICYCKEDHTLWVVCASKYLLHYSVKGELINVFDFNYADQDHICFNDGFLYMTVGADYGGNDNFVCKVNPRDGSIVGVYRTMRANSLEGICYQDNKVIIVNDGLYHSDITGHSYFTVYSDDVIKK